MKRIILSLLFLANFITNLFYAQQSYQPVYPNYSMDLTKAGSNNPTGNLFTYQGSIVPVYEVGKIDNTPTYKHAFYQWNITSNNIPTVAIVDSVVISFRLQFVNSQTSELNYFNCILDLSDPNLNKNTLWNYSDKNQFTPIGSGLINTPAGNYVTHNHKFINGSSFVNSFLNSIQQSNRFTLGIAWKFESPSAGNTYWRIFPEQLTLKVYYRIPNQSVTLDQRLSNNTQVGKLRKWEGSEIGFTPPPYINPGTPFDFPLLSTQVIQGDQAIYSNEKYLKWVRNTSDESNNLNHHTFTIQSNDFNFISKFNPTNSDIIIKNSLEQSSVNGGNIHFQDPWLVDYPDPLYGNTLRNRGMDAPFKQRTSPFYPDYTTSYNGDVYKGVFLNQSGPPLWTPPYYSVKADYLQTFNLSQTGRTHKFYFQGWSASLQGSAEFQNANSLETPVVFKQANATVQANYKGTQLSNNSLAYSKGSQRKFIRITNGRLYSVYESMGNIYLERSTDNGVSWEIFNQDAGKKLNIYPAHSPSMDFYNVSSSSGDVILVTFVEDLSAAEARVMVVGLSDKLPSPLLFTQVVSLLDKSVSGYGNPVIACAGAGKFIIAFKGWDIGSYGIYYRRGVISNWQLNWVEQDIYNLPKLLNTDNLSLNPTIAEDRNTSGVSYQVAWEQSNAIRYCKLTEDANGNITQSSHSVISTGSSFMFHSSPSIIAIGTGARVCWLGYQDEDPPNATVVFKDPSNSHFWSFGSNASRPNINKSNDNTYYAFAWSQNNSTIKFADNGLSGVYEMIGITGKDVQLSNGNGKTNMYANIFKATSQPYFFTMSNNLNHYYSLQKSNGLLVSNGRTGVLRKNNAEIYFALGDISVDQQKVGFTECSPETEITDVNILNQYLESQPFEVTDNSGFEYTVQYGVVDTSVINGMFTQGEQVRFKVELVDNNTGELLGVYDDVIYDQNNHTDFENILYWVNTQGIGQRTVKLRLNVESNPGVEVSMVDRIDTESALGKSKRREMQYQGETLPKEFALEQNYPNPFNPTTVISWQSPVGGHQTLKIYDILGNEVATLVDEYKEAGRYKLEYDASNLASGVYIYKLTAGSFVSSKKMMVIK